MSNNVASQKTKTLPLEGIRVIESSTGMAGRLAGLLLADQGAEVLICRKTAAVDEPLDLYLDRGKYDYRGAVTPNYSDALLIIQDGIGTTTRLPGQIRLCITAVLPGDTEYSFSDDVGDDVLKAVVGFYTDLATVRKLIGEDVIYTPLPLCSIYAGVLGAIAAGAAIAEHQTFLNGRDIVISRLAASLAAIGVLALEVKGLPEHLKYPSMHKNTPTQNHMIEKARGDVAYFEWLKRRMNPFFACYKAACGRQIMVCSLASRRSARGLLEVLGLWDEMVADGLVDLWPYDKANSSYSDRNIALPPNLRDDFKEKLSIRIAEKLSTKTADLWVEIFNKSNIVLAIVSDFDTWRSSFQAQQSGLTEQVIGCKWLQLGRAVRFDSAKPYPPLHVAYTGTDLPTSYEAPVVEAKKNMAAPLRGLKVLDLSNIVAGPACGRILAELGAEVIKVDSVRPDHSPTITVEFTGELSQGKRSILIDLRHDRGRKVLHCLVKQSDVIVLNRQDSVVKQMGLDKDEIAKLNPDAVAIQLTAFKGERKSIYDDFRGYDPLLQAATGIMSRFGSIHAPELHGMASCVDYLTGYLAAYGAVVGLVSRFRRGGGDWVDTSLASAASLVQMPFQVTPAPVGVSGCLRKTKDGWICVEPADAVLPDLHDLTVKKALKVAKKIGVVSAPVQSISQLKARHLDHPCATVAFRKEAGAFSTVNLRPTWFQFDGNLLPETSAATWPGSDVVEILKSSGYTSEEIIELFTEGAIGMPLWGCLSDD